ncbi:MAG: hypothetical protein Q4D76_18810 [Oscillospiraceae bacterium]|nr:hypothetical protein [Oscillospiraceae bacterium]
MELAALLFFGGGAIWIVVWFVMLHITKKEFIYQYEVYSNPVKCPCDSVEDFYKLLSGPNDYGIKSVQFNEENNTFIVERKYKHVLIYNDGYIEIQHPKFKSVIWGRSLLGFFRQLFVSKQVKQIIDGNEILDKMIMETNDFELSKMQHRNNYKRAQVFQSIMILDVVFLFLVSIVAIFVALISGSDKAVEITKNYQVYDDCNITLGEVLDNSLSGVQWIGYNEEENNAIVEVEGYYIYDGERIPVLIQFGYDRNITDLREDDAISSIYIEIDGEAWSGKKGSDFIEYIADNYRNSIGE